MKRPIYLATLIPLILAFMGCQNPAADKPEPEVAIYTVTGTISGNLANVKLGIYHADLFFTSNELSGGDPDVVIREFDDSGEYTPIYLYDIADDGKYSLNLPANPAEANTVGALIAWVDADDDGKLDLDPAELLSESAFFPVTEYEDQPLASYWFSFVEDFLGFTGYLAAMEGSNNVALEILGTFDFGIR